MSQPARVILIRKQDDPEYPYYTCDLSGVKIEDLKTLGAAKIIYAGAIKEGKVKLYRDFGKNARRAFVKRNLPDAPQPTVAFKGPPFGPHTTGMMKMV